MRYGYGKTKRLLASRFDRLGIKPGEQISFADDDSIVATVAGPREVEYKGRTWKLSPLTAAIYRANPQLKAPRSYDNYGGFGHWRYNGQNLYNIKLKKWPQAD